MSTDYSKMRIVHVDEHVRVTVCTDMPVLPGSYGTIPVTALPDVQVEYAEGCDCLGTSRWVPALSFGGAAGLLHEAQGLRALAVALAEAKGWRRTATSTRITWVHQPDAARLEKGL